MGQTIIAERTQTNVPIGIDVTRDGGITGLTLVFRLYRGDVITEFLDFGDGVFKAAGHATPTQVLGEIGLGRYELAGGFDLSAITLPAAAEHLIAQYEITAGGESGNDSDLIDLVDEHKAIASSADLDRVLAFAAQDNVMLDGGPNAADAAVPDYDSAGLMLEGRMRAFDTAANRALATPGNVAVEAGELFRQLISATSSTPGEADSYTSDRNL